LVFDLVATIVKLAVFLGLFLGLVAPIMVWVERKAAGLFQDRPGPNRLGPFGLFQPLADALKFFFKEDVTPALADKPLFLMAPALAVLPALTTFVFIPFGPTGAASPLVSGRAVPMGRKSGPYFRAIEWRLGIVGHSRVAFRMQSFKIK
jgi:NADH-quinone oxidoreductase subunit H